METRTGITIVLVLLTGCSQSPADSGPAPTPTSQVTTVPIPSLRTQGRNKPRKLKFLLTLDMPQDLKVKEGDSVSQGQVISDRKAAQARLQKEHQSLLVKLELLKAKTVTVPTNYAIEQAEVKHAKLAVEHAIDAVSLYQANSPWTDYARQVLPLTDNLELAELEDQYEQERAKLDITIAHLQAAKTKHQVLQVDTSVQQAELLRRMTALEEKLDSLGVVRSPYSGEIRSVKWLGQRDNKLQVELILTIDLSQRFESDTRYEDDV